MRIAYFLGGFPLVSQTFVLAQVAGMIKRGHDVYIEAERPSEWGHILHEDFEAYRVNDRIDYLPALPKNVAKRMVSAAGRITHHAWKCPAQLWDSLNVFKYGKNALTLRVFNERFPAGRKRQKFDVIHCHFGPHGKRAMVRRKAGLLQGPVITTFHGFDANVLPKTFGAGYYKSLFAEGELFTVGSEFMRRRVIALGVPQNRIVKHPMGVDTSKYKFLERQVSDKQMFNILSIGRLVEVKGFEYLLRALSILKTSPIQIRCIVAGDGPLRGKLEQLSLQLGIAQMVKFVGAISQEQGFDLYRQAHCFVLPSVVTESGEEEGQAIVLAEAQACGIPVVATATGGIPESFKDKESGLLVPQRDPEAIATAIRWLVQHKEAWPQMGKSGRAYVEEHFDLNILNDQLVELYSKVSANQHGF